MQVVPELPAEILLVIAETSPVAFACMVRAVPAVARLARGAHLTRIKAGFTTIETDHLRIMYVLCGKMHREYDEPALIYKSGTLAWYKHGELHRDGDLPAYVPEGVAEIWYQHGKIHRDNNKPAAIFPDGSQIYYHKGEKYLTTQSGA